MKKLQLNKLSLSDSSKLSAKEKKEIAGGSNLSVFCGKLCPFDFRDPYACVGYECIRCSQIPAQYAYLCKNAGGIITA